MPTFIRPNYLTASYLGTEFDWVYGNGPVYTHTNWPHKGGYLTTEKHPNYKRRIREGSPNVGGAFRMLKYGNETELSKTTRVYRPFSAGQVAYYGQFRANYPVALSQVPTRSAWEFGAQAFAKARESLTKPDFGALYSILEMRDFPRLATTMLNFKKFFTLSGVKKTKAIADLHLAHEFGWKATVGEIKNFVEAVDSASKRIDQLIRDNGRAVRRKGTIYENKWSTYSKSSTSGAASAYPVLVTQCYKDLGTSETIETFTAKAWYSGRFRYYLPAWAGGRMPDRKKLFRALAFGGTPSPSDLYNLMPWTWLIDYFTNLGKFFEAVSGGVEENFIADYCYVMYEESHLRQHRVQFKVYTANNWDAFDQIEATSVASRVYKSRESASVFGFGTSQKSLSGKQWSILGALGISQVF